MTAARLPPPLRPGDRVGIAALSGAVDGDRLEAGIASLIELGFEPVEAGNLRSKQGMFAGADTERLRGFHRLASDPSVRAVIFARGGHGLLRILPDIDWSLLARFPRAYVGYSDVTPFLLEVTRRLALVTFHGPMLAAEIANGLDPAERASLLDTLGGDFPRRFDLEILVDRGSVNGTLIGGCLSMLVATLGTPFAPRFGRSLLFLEDVDEPLYRLDRMLTHLRLSGNLSRIRGLIAGHMTGRSEPSEIEQRLTELASRYSWTLASGLNTGHARPNLTVPIGIRTRLDAATGSLVAGL